MTTERQIAGFIGQMKAAKEAGTLTEHAVKLTSGKGWLRLDLVPAQAGRWAAEGDDTLFIADDHVVLFYPDAVLVARKEEP